MHIGPLALILVALVSLSGCMVVQRNIEFSGERLQPKFESKEVKKLFYETYEAPKPFHADATFFFTLPAVFGMRWTVHGNEAWNYYVKKADFDDNLLITREEIDFLRNTAIAGRADPEKEDE